MQSSNREQSDSVWRPTTAPASEPPPVSGRRSRIWKRVLRGGAVLGLALLATGPLACAEPEPDEDATREEKPKYEW